MKEIKILKMFVPEINENSNEDQINEAVKITKEKARSVIEDLQLMEGDEEFFDGLFFKLHTETDNLREQILQLRFNMEFKKDELLSEKYRSELFNVSSKLEETNRKIMFYEFIYSEIDNKKKED